MDGKNDSVSPESFWTLNQRVADDRRRAFVKGISWSGNERNFFFVGGLPGNQFADLSAVSGLDDPADGRGFSLLDFDRDGWLDVALVNVSRPRLRLLRNTMGDAGLDVNHAFVAFRFVGGNHEPRPSREWSARDGFGTSVELDLGDHRSVYREHQTESSIKAQNSATMLIGIGDQDTVRKVTIRWLSGRIQTSSDLAAGSLVTVYENPADSPTGETFVVESYRVDPSQMTRLPRSDDWRSGFLPGLPGKSRFHINDAGQGRAPRPAKLILYTTMATWCVNCLEEMPEFRQLREWFDENELAIYGVPIDQEETAEMLEGWADKYNPPYELLVGLPQNQVNAIDEVVLSELHLDGVPAAIVTDASGHVLMARWGVPTVSTLKKFLWKR